MINIGEFVRQLKDIGIERFYGVPDSLLSSLSAYLQEKHSDRNLITANEGNAVGCSIGSYISTGRPAVVYLQNSGLGNAINPLISLASGSVLSVPILLVVGWRGMPGVSDEPQHLAQGAITRDQLALLGIPVFEVDHKTNVADVLRGVSEQFDTHRSPVALLVHPNTFEKYSYDFDLKNLGTMSREESIEEIVDQAGDAAIVATTGKTARELNEVRLRKGHRNDDLLTVGGMGHAASIALGMAQGAPDQQVICLDGDGSLLMHMGGIAVVASQKNDNLIYVLLNNACHESVGGQPTIAGSIDFLKLSQSLGFDNYRKALSRLEIAAIFQEYKRSSGTYFIEINIKPGSRKDLGRPSTSPYENIDAVMRKMRAVSSYDC
ncbi:phosphonopyruvate decarboxylase [Gammaproteobacteria bacterium]|nr:phosphonopyruvate decarboxylase [Gammaproteobacteria bacterium]